MICRKCGTKLLPTDHEARKCPKCGVWTFVEGSFREQLCEDAVSKWIDGPEDIEEFCDWLISEALTRYAAELTKA